MPLYGGDNSESRTDISNNYWYRKFSGVALCCIDIKAHRRGTKPNRKLEKYTEKALFLSSMRRSPNKGSFSLREKYTFPYEKTQKIFRRFYTMKKQKWTEKPITWGGYLKLAGVCSIISLMMSAYYLFAAFDIHPIESVKEAIHRRFSKETAEE